MHINTNKASILLQSPGIFMMIMQPDGETIHGKDPFLVNKQIAKLIRAFHPQFERVVRAHFYFHLFFLCLGVLELLFIGLFFNYLIENALLASALALLFLTFFSYIILRMYCQTRKPEQLKDLKNRFSGAVKEVLEYQPGEAECHMAVADTYSQLAQSFSGKEYGLYRPRRWLAKLAPALEKLSFRMHWQDVFIIREMALCAAVEEQIQLVKCEPTSLEAHTALANAYILLSGLYTDQRGQEDEEEKRFTPSKQHTEELNRKFRESAERAIEEFKILCNYAPNDPWVHEQLAYSYCDLQMPLEAIAEYELILKFNPGDPEILYRLGTLYFRLGRNAQGLQVYEQLRRMHYKKAELLIADYGAYDLPAGNQNKKDSF